MGDYTHNHYVPIWYQERFMLSGQHRYFRLDLKPDMLTSGKVKYTRHDVHEWSPWRVFAQDDLYTTRWGGVANVEIEQFFFGQLDNAAPRALDFFARLDELDVDSESFQTLMRYMSVQKLRTPKGLGLLAAVTRSSRSNETLMLLQQFQNLFCAVWTECVWQIGDASESPTKFIISDHPVTVYNRACPPLSKWCTGFDDPDVRMHASHTYFPLSLDKVLILTNLSWVRNPYQNELKARPNMSLLRDTVFNFMAIQVGRKFTEDEVLQMNYITKRRAFRYIAAAQREWLYPEKRVSTDHWKKLGDGYLLMPEPRLVGMGGEMMLKYTSGRVDAFNEYGHKPWQKGYKDEARDRRESEALYRFQAEWALKRGAKYTSHNNEFGGNDMREDDEDMMSYRRTVLKRHRGSRPAG
jgi:hypothetical protein